MQTQITDKIEFWFFHYKKIHYFQIFFACKSTKNIKEKNSETLTRSQQQQ